jgi:archaemetzincin
MPDKINLVSIGAIDDALLSYLKEELAKIFPSAVELGAVIPIPKNCFNPRRRQYYSPLILKELGKKKKSGEVILGIIDLDLYVEGLNFIFGQADLSNRTGIISLTRLREEFYGKEGKEKIFYKRALTEAVHELGHIFGLPHCRNPNCVMFFSNSIHDTDRKGYSFCPACQKKISLSDD